MKTFRWLIGPLYPLLMLMGIVVACLACSSCSPAERQVIHDVGVNDGACIVAELGAVASCAGLHDTQCVLAATLRLIGCFVRPAPPVVVPASHAVPLGAFRREGDCSPGVLNVTQRGYVETVRLIE